MIKHVLLLKFDKKENLILARKWLNSIWERVPSVQSLETGLNIQKGSKDFQLILITTHNSIQELDDYQKDPVHSEIRKKILELNTERTVFDFESGLRPIQKQDAGNE